MARCRSANAAPAVGRTHGVGFAELVESLSRTSGSNEAATVPASRTPGLQQSEPERAARWPGDGVAARSLTLRSLAGPPRSMKATRCVVPAGTASPSCPDLLHGEAVWVLAVAPEHYDVRDTDGTETWVILAPICRWAKHPILSGDEPRPTGVRRAWEAFLSDGEPVGLVLLTEPEFVGVDLSGDARPERTLAGAAWQIVVNA
ncbi:MAG: hypothetical protein INR70_16940 [Parafilimonas terrae]|nr:hypothetical protein [Parafilimonas terrae]